FSSLGPALGAGRAHYCARRNSGMLEEACRWLGRGACLSNAPGTCKLDRIGSARACL
ncbi:hypothetical protein A2U01_0071007, partial [Trifolium medium]|nr:hypothetical protein [Trifolium medium]